MLSRHYYVAAILSLLSMRQAAAGEVSIPDCDDVDFSTMFAPGGVGCKTSGDCTSYVTSGVELYSAEGDGTTTDCGFKLTVAGNPATVPLPACDVSMAAQLGIYQEASCYVPKGDCDTVSGDGKEGLVRKVLSIGDALDQCAIEVVAAGSLNMKAHSGSAVPCDKAAVDALGCDEAYECATTDSCASLVDAGSSVTFSGSTRQDGTNVCAFENDCGAIPSLIECTSAMVSSLGCNEELVCGLNTASCGSFAGGSIGLFEQFSMPSGSFFSYECSFTSSCSSSRSSRQHKHQVVVADGEVTAPSCSAVDFSTLYAPGAVGCTTSGSSCTGSSGKAKLFASATDGSNSDCLYRVSDNDDPSVTVDLPACDVSMGEALGVYQEASCYVPKGDCTSVSGNGKEGLLKKVLSLGSNFDQCGLEVVPAGSMLKAHAADACDASEVNSLDCNEAYECTIESGDCASLITDTSAVTSSSYARQDGLTVCGFEGVCANTIPELAACDASVAGALGCDEEYVCGLTTESCSSFTGTNSGGATVALFDQLKLPTGASFPIECSLTAGCASASARLTKKVTAHSTTLSSPDCDLVSFGSLYAPGAVGCSTSGDCSSNAITGSVEVFGSKSDGTTTDCAYRVNLPGNPAIVPMPACDVSMGETLALYQEATCYVPKGDCDTVSGNGKEAIVREVVSLGSTYDQCGLEVVPASARRKIHANSRDACDQAEVDAVGCNEAYECTLASGDCSSLVSAGGSVVLAGTGVQDGVTICGFEGSCAGAAAPELAECTSSNTNAMGCDEELACGLSTATCASFEGANSGGAVIATFDQFSTPSGSSFPYECSFVAACPSTSWFAAVVEPMMNLTDNAWMWILVGVVISVFAMYAKQKMDVARKDGYQPVAEESHALLAKANKMYA